MPHPEHAVDPLTGPSRRRPRLLHLGAGAVDGMSEARAETAEDPALAAGASDTVTAAAATPAGPALRRARPDRRRVRSGSPACSAAARPTPSWPSTRSCGASTARTSPPACTCASSPRRRRRPTSLLAGIGENAGVVDIGQGYAVTFKIESHNHPSYVEPFQGAATGVGGIVRDILAMGARPVAVMDALRFGPAGRARHPPRAARRRGRHLVLRQLPRPAQHRRRAGLRPLLRRATRWSTRSAWACSGPPT